MIDVILSDPLEVCPAPHRHSIRHATCPYAVPQICSWVKAGHFQNTFIEQWLLKLHDITKGNDICFSLHSITPLEIILY